MAGDGLWERCCVMGIDVVFERGMGRLRKEPKHFFYGSIFCVLLRYQVGTKLLIWNIKEAAMTGRGLAKRRRIPAPNMFSLGCLLQLQSVPWVCAGAWEQHRYVRRLWALPGAKKGDKKSWIASRVWEFHLLCGGFRRVNLKQALHCVLCKTGDLMKGKKRSKNFSHSLHFQDFQ